MLASYGFLKILSRQSIDTILIKNIIQITSSLFGHVI